MVKDIRKGVFENIQNTLNSMNINYKVNLSEHSFTLDNGTYIICKGLHSTTKREKLKAFADLEKYEFAIEWREEADQLTREEISELDCAVRGAKRKFIINSSNPESLKRYIIGYCNEIMPFDEELMRLNYDQIGKFKINHYEKNEKFTKTVIIHYSSWRLNTYLDVDVKRKQIVLEKLDPERARVWSWGLPGNTSGSIFARYIDIMQATDIIQPTKLLGGVDLANSTSPKGHTTAASFWLYNSFDKKAYKVAEYRKQYYTKMFDIVLKYYGLWDGTGECPYGFDFVSASLVDQMRQNELITARLDNGTMELIRAITEYDNIDELEATKYFEKVEAWQDKMQAKEIEHNNKLLEYDETGNNQNALQGRTEIKEN